MGGRRPYPFQVISASNKKDRFTAETLKARQANQPDIQTATLKCPRHLSKGAKREWKRITELYGELKDPIINDLDLNALEIYCEAVVTYHKATLEVRKTTEVYMAGTVAKKNPWLTVADNAAMMIKKYGEILLLDPVSRARVGLAKSKTEEKSGVGKFLQKRAEGT
jgi:P27 family predicted phage terminase small subunit